MKTKLKMTLICMLALLIVCAYSAQAERSTLKLPDGLKYIRREAFENDTSLDRVVLPEGVLLIYPKAFANSSIREIYMPASTGFISPDSFEGCDNLTAIIHRDSFVHQYINTYLKDLKYTLIEPERSEEELEEAKYHIHSVTPTAQSESGASFLALVDTSEACTLKISLYDEDNEDGEALLELEAKASAGLSSGEIAAHDAQGEIPDYYVLKAALIRTRDGKQMGSTYVSREHTRLYAQMKDTSEDDYTGCEVISFGDAGYAVLTENTLVIDQDFYSIYEYRFTPPRPLQKGDMLLVTVKGVPRVVKVGSITNNDDGTVTVRPDEDITLADAFDHLKISGYMQGSDTGLITPGSPAGDVKTIPFSPSLSFGPVTLGGEASASVLLDLVFDKKSDYFSIEFWIENEGELSVELSKGFDTADLDDPLEIPLYNAPVKIPGTDIGAKLSVTLPLDIKLEAGGSAKISYKNKTGFTYNSIDDQLRRIQEKSASGEAKIESGYTISTGPEVSLRAELMDMLEAKISGEVSVELKGELTGLEYGGSTSGTAEESVHACGACMDCDINIIAGVFGTLDVDITENISFSALDSPLIEFKEKIADAFWSIRNEPASIYGGKEKHGLGECENNKYRASIYTYDMNHEELKGIATTLTGEKIKPMSGKSPSYAYLYPGDYNAAATINSVVWNTDFTIADKPEYVTVQEEESILRGKVSSSRSGAPLPGASVTLTLPSGKKQTAVTDENGDYIFRKLAAGTYTLSFSADSHESYTTPKLDLKPGMSWPFNVTLEAEALTPIMARLSSYPSGSFTPAKATDMSGGAIAENIVMTPTKTFGYNNRAMSEMKLENRTTGSSYTLSIPEKDFCMTAQLYGADMGDGAYTYVITTYTDASRNRCIVLREGPNGIYKELDFTYLGQTDSVYGENLDREDYVDYNNAQSSDSAYGIFRTSGIMLKNDGGGYKLSITVNEGHYDNGWTLAETVVTYYRLVGSKLTIVDQFFR